MLRCVAAEARHAADFMESERDRSEMRSLVEKLEKRADELQAEWRLPANSN